MSLTLLFMGLTGEFSFVVLDRLLAAGVRVAAVVLPRPRTEQAGPAWQQLAPETPATQLPLRQPYLQRSIVHLAWEHALPAFQVADFDSPVPQEMLLPLAADVGCVACFDRRLPRSWLEVLPQGFLNLHPSLLPEFRGPVPLFWTLRQGIRETGVTLHFMDEELDKGDIALQTPLSLPDGISGAEADRLAAGAGAGLLLAALSQLAAGDLPRRPQPAGGSYQGWPTAADFSLDTRWSARRAFNFMRGTAEWQRPYSLAVAGETIWLREALSFDESAAPPRPLLREGGRFQVQFRPGVLIAG